jgi:acylphosphatase
VKLRITGLVHGVFFRASMAEEAANRGVSGWVRNMADGSVRAFLEGEEEKVMRIVDWAKHGPPRARVDRVIVERVRPKNSKSFRIEG